MCLERFLSKENEMRILELFAGIGACSKALERLGFNVEIEMNKRKFRKRINTNKT